MRLKFTKMHGLGNDFVVIDAINQSVALNAEQFRFLADRHYGIGCDQLLLVETYAGDDADFRYRIFNADGSEVEHCGNGARCFARFVLDQGLTNKTEIPVMTDSGRIVLMVQEDGQVTVNMGIPRFEPADIPLSSATMPERKSHYQLDIDGQAQSFGAVSLGNPHITLPVSSVADAPVIRLGAVLESHEAFPNRINVGFMQVIDRKNILLRVFERGVGETQACGTGACAAAVIGMSWGELDEQVTVSLPGGDLTIAWAGYGQPILMTGPAESVFTGSINL